MLSALLRTQMCYFATDPDILIRAQMTEGFGWSYMARINHGNA